MIKSGLVVETNKRYACLLSSDGQFTNVAIKGKVPLKGEIYTGELYKKTPVHRLPLMAAIIVFMIFLSGGFYTYYTPAAEVTITINPAVRLNLNVWNKIIKSVPLNEDGEKLLSSLQLKNKDLNTGLDMIVNQAKVDNFINRAYVESDKVISVEVVNDNKRKLDLSKFQQSVKAQKLKVEIVNETKSKSDSKNSEFKNLDSEDKLKQDENREIKNDNINKSKDDKANIKEKTDGKSNDDNNKDMTIKGTKKTIDKNTNNPNITGDTDRKEKEYNDKNKDKKKEQVNSIITIIKDKISKVKSAENSKKNNSNNKNSRGKVDKPNKNKSSK
jgi:hypothetical protein